MPARKGFLIALGIAAFVGIAASSYAQQGGGSPATRMRRPQSAVTNTGTLRNIGHMTRNIDNGLQVSDHRPGRIQRGIESAPVPRFGKINTPVWVTTPETSSLQILNDVIVHGLTEVKTGLISNASANIPARSTASPQTTATSQPVSPLNIFDDLIVGGNGSSEPGNVKVDATTYTGNLIVLGTVQQNLSLNGQLSAGQTNVTAPHTLNGNARVIGGKFTITGPSQLGGNVTLGTQSAQASLLMPSGKLTGTEIGRYYQIGANGVNVSTQSWGQSSTASCNVGDILISCAAEYAAPERAPSTVWVPEYRQNSCTIRARLTSPQSAAFVFKAKANCFSPDG